MKIKYRKTIKLDKAYSFKLYDVDNWGNIKNRVIAIEFYINNKMVRGFILNPSKNFEIEWYTFNDGTNFSHIKK